VNQLKESAFNSMSAGRELSKRQLREVGLLRASTQVFKCLSNISLIFIPVQKCGLPNSRFTPLEASTTGGEMFVDIDIDM
jgi:hypothetical protein